jgi:PAS domain S-box-containing protein
MTKTRREQALHPANQQLRRELAEQAQMKGALRTSGTRLTEILDVADDAIIMVNAQQEITFFNQGAERIFGYAAPDMIAQPLDRLLPPRLREVHRQHLQQFMMSADVACRMGERRSISGQRADGTEFPAEAAISKLINDGELILTVILRDVTARVQAEDTLRAALAEQAILLKEVHHRVKNNLQVVISLLRLQSRSVVDASVVAALRDGQQRVEVMVLVHELLYCTDDLAHIDTATYVRHLSEQLLRIYASASQTITVEVDVDPIWLDLDHAVPCGLIINELLSNSLKYAFPDGQPGTIGVNLWMSAPETLTLRVWDTGCGLPAAAIHPSEHSLGMRLVHSLAHQLRGTLSIEATAGTSVTIRFPVGMPPVDMDMAAPGTQGAYYEAGSDRHRRG